MAKVKEHAARCVAAVAALVCVSLLVAACGGDSDSNGSSASTSADDSSANVAEAQAFVEEYLVEPDSHGITEPLSEKPPADKKIVSVLCDLPVCKIAQEETGKAAETLGWEYEGIVTSGTPEDIVKKIDAALQKNPDGIVLSGFSRDVAGSALEKAEQQGVPVVNSGVPDEVAPPYVSVINSTPLFQRDGEILGNFLVADSEGDAHVAIFNVPDFPILVSLTESIEKTVKDQCPSCTVEVVDQQLKDIGTSTPANVVSTLQSNPEINYVVFTDGNFAAGVAPALRDAGFADKVKIVGQNASSVNLENVINGTEYAWLAYPVPWYSWAAIDALAREYVGDDPKTDPLASPTMLQTKENTKSSDPWVPPGLEESFKTLWHVN